MSAKTFPTHGSELSALLRACHAQPEDDTPRLVLADWLQEHDDPRGELVRLQCQLAALPAGDPEYDALFGRHQKWWRIYGAAWRREFDDFTHDPGPYDRGLPTIGYCEDGPVALDTYHLRRDEAELNPRLTAAIATGWPGISWVRVPLPGSGADWDDDDDFADAPSLRATGDPFAPLRQAPWKNSPTPLGVWLPRGISTARHIDALTKLPNVRGLSLSGSGLRRGDHRLVKRAAATWGLEHLDLGSTPLDDIGLTDLWSFIGLRTLVARRATKITAAGAEYLASRFPNLRELRLGNVKLSAGALKALAKLTKLEVLQLEHADDNAIRHLAPLGQHGRLRRLHLDGTAVTGRGLENFPLLTHVTLNVTPATDAGLAGLARLPRLRVLSVNKTAITGSGLAHLDGLRWLDTLSAAMTALRDSDLARLGGLTSLESLRVNGTKVTKKGADALKAKLKRLAVTYGKGHGGS